MTAARGTPHLQAPPPPARLRGVFPSRAYRAGAVLYRSHPGGRGPWWFSCSAEGRFDLAAPLGTCYLAEDELVTLLETWGGLQVVPSYLADTRAVSTVAVARNRGLADLTDNQATGFGVTAEVFTTTDYDLTQLWASALHSAGFSGVRYWARHDLRHGHACVALFDTAGDHTPSARGGGDYQVAGTASVVHRTDLTGRLEAEAGITVLPVPPRRRP